MLRKGRITPKTVNGLYTISESYSIDEVWIVVQSYFVGVPSGALRYFSVNNLVHGMNVVERETKLLLYL